MIPANVTSLAI